MVISGGVSLSVRGTFGETFSSATFSGQSPVLGSPTPEGPPLVHIPRRDILSQRPQGKPSEWGIKVLGARTPQEASQIAQELQTTWEQTARLADRWTQTHRRPDFAGRSLTVVIGQTRIAQTQFSAPPRQVAALRLLPGVYSSESLLWQLDQQPPTMLLADAGSDRTPEEVLRELKRQMVFAFLSYLPNGQQTPLWVRWGLAEYMAGASGETPWPSRMPPVQPLLREPEWGRAAPEHLEISPETYASAGQWVRYFLEGRDAQYAPVFVEAMASAHSRRDMERLLNQIAVASGPAGQWAPQYGQPVVRPVSSSMSMGQTERKMVFLLKLAWRFSAPSAGQALQPKILEQGQDRSLQLAWAGQKALQTTPRDLASLRQRIMDPTRPQWATLDWEGRLLFSDESARWTAYFQELQPQCRVLQQEGKTLWRLSDPAGGVLEGWLEENRSDPGRPIVCLRRVPS